MSDMNATHPSRSQMPSWLPEKFWDPEIGDIRVEALARSYNELERLMSSAGETSFANQPDSPDGYELNVDDLLGVDADVNKRLYDAGFSNDQAQLVYDLAAEQLLPLVQQITDQVDEARQQDQGVQHFGGADRFEAMRPKRRAWGQANLKPDVFQALAGSAEGVIALHAMMQNREPGLNGVTSPGAGAGEADLKRMMADPRYWREREPAYVAQVREGFRQLYPDA